MTADLARTPTPQRVCAIVLGVVFFLAALKKSVQPAETVRFTQAIADLLGWAGSRTEIHGLVTTVGIVEMALGAVLFAGVGARVCGVAALGLLLLFTSGIVLVAASDRSLPCGCGLNWLMLGYELGPWGLVGRNTVLLALAAVVARGAQSVVR